MDHLPLVIEFVAGTRLKRESSSPSKVPIIRNGLPGTFVIFPCGKVIPLPTDQIVASEDSGGSAIVGFGGMEFEGYQGAQLFFERIKEVLPEELLSPERGQRMLLDANVIVVVRSYGKLVWKAGEIVH